MNLLPQIALACRASAQTGCVGDTHMARSKLLMVSWCVHCRPLDHCCRVQRSASDSCPCIAPAPAFSRSRRAFQAWRRRQQQFWRRLSADNNLRISNECWCCILVIAFLFAHCKVDDDLANLAICTLKRSPDSQLHWHCLLWMVSAAVQLNFHRRFLAWSHYQVLQCLYLSCR